MQNLFRVYTISFKSQPPYYSLKGNITIVNRLISVIKLFINSKYSSWTMLNCDKALKLEVIIQRLLMLYNMYYS